MGLKTCSVKVSVFHVLSSIIIISCFHSRLTSTLCAELSSLAGKFCERLNVVANEESTENASECVNPIITNIYLEVSSIRHKTFFMHSKNWKITCFFFFLFVLFCFVLFCFVFLVYLHASLYDIIATHISDCVTNWWYWEAMSILLRYTSYVEPWK